MADDNDLDLPETQPDIPPILQGLQRSKPTPVQTLTGGEVEVDEEAKDPERTFQRVVDWTPDDVLGAGEYQDIYWRPDGVPEEYPTDWLPGIRFRKISAEDLKKFQRIHSGKRGNDGDPIRAENFLLRKCFVQFLNMNIAGDPLEYLFETEKGNKLKAFAMTEFIIREVPSTAQGKASGQRFKRS